MNWQKHFVSYVLTAVLSLVSMEAAADIYQWEYISPTDHSLGRQASDQLVPDGAGLIPGPNVDFSNKDLTQAYLPNVDLSNANLNGTTLTAADLTNAQFTNADLTNATVIASLSGVELTGAKIRGANLAASGITPEQLISTESYQQGDLSNINLVSNDLRGFSFSDLNLENSALHQTNIQQVDFRRSKMSGVSLRNTNAVGADFTDAQLNGAEFDFSQFRDASFSGADLRDAFFSRTQLLRADFSGADIRGANFSDAPWLNIDQIYSTVSYQQRDLSGVRLAHVDLSNADFREFNLTDTNFDSSTLTGADFTGAEIANISLIGVGKFSLNQLYSTANYQRGDLSGIGTNAYLAGGEFADMALVDATLNRAHLENADFTRSDLSDSSLIGAYLAGAILLDAEIRGVHFSFSTNLTREQIYSTRSYKQKDLSGVRFDGVNLSEWDLSGLVLTDSGVGDARVIGTDFSSSDLRGLRPLSSRMKRFIISTNTIMGDGRIDGLSLTEGRKLTVHDYETSLIDVTVKDSFMVDDTGVLELVLDDNGWTSTIRFEDSIPVAISGQLIVSFEDTSAPRLQLGQTLKLFDWSNVDPVGKFEFISDYQWDTSQLYTSGEVTLLAVPEPRGVILLLLALNWGIALRRGE